MAHAARNAAFTACRVFLQSIPSALSLMLLARANLIQLRYRFGYANNNSSHDTRVLCAFARGH